MTRLENTICDVRAECEEMFYTVASDDIPGSVEIAKRAMELLYKSQIKVHKELIDHTNKLMESVNADGGKLPAFDRGATAVCEARITSHKDRIFILEDKITALKYI